MLQRLIRGQTVPPVMMSCLALSAIGRVGLAEDVPWLEAVVAAPSSVPDAERGHFAPLLSSEQGEAIQTLDQWKHRRAELRRQWLDFLGPMPERPPVTLKVLAEDRDAGVLRQLIEYDSEPDQPVQAYLLTPLNPPEGAKLPAVVALHPTSDLTIDEIAGKAGPESKHLGLKLAQRGFVVICPRNFLWQDVEKYEDAVARFKQRHPNTLGMHKMLYDAMRAVDVLEQIPIVDKDRIGCMGHSLGGKEALYLAAFDDRIRAAAGSELGMGFTFTNWNAPWYLGEAIRENDFPLNHHQLVAMIAPRPFLLLAGESGGRGVADGDRSWPYLEAAHQICTLYDQPVRIGMYNHGEGHTVSDASFERIAEWLTVYLNQ